MQYDLIKCGSKNSIVNFPHSDDEKRWRKQKKIQSSDWKYHSLKTNPIYFNTNSIGYRTHEFEFNEDSEYLMTFGCSNTYGLYLHEQERYSNLIEDNTRIKTYNLGICGGSAGLIMTNLSKFLYSNVKKPSAVIIQWPEYMRLNFVFSEPHEGIYNVRANTRYGSKIKVFEELVRHGNILETYSLWAKDTVCKMLDSFNIKVIEFVKDREESDFYNVPCVEKIDRAYDNKHIGTLTNQEISNFVIERL